jgi:hypothetical protein
MSCKKTVIHEFDPCIYPRLLWGVKGGTLEEIRKTLEFGDIEDDFYNSSGAITIAAYDNQKKKEGFLSNAKSVKKLAPPNVFRVKIKNYKQQT